jgi:hypothetical protein
MKFNIFCTDNIPDILISQHSKCCDLNDIEVEYHKIKYENEFLKRYTQHGEIMNWLMTNSPEEVVCFLDLDCLPYNKTILEQAYEWVKENQSFCGNAQNVSHTQMKNHIYAAPSMLMIHKSAWENLGSPNLSCVFENGLTQIDTAQLLTLRADQMGFPYQLMYPIGYDGPDAYKLSGYGNYGRGTLYPATYHYFALIECIDNIPELWNKRVNNILNQEQIIPNYKSCYYGL